MSKENQDNSEKKEKTLSSEENKFKKKITVKSLPKIEQSINSFINKPKPEEESELARQEVISEIKKLVKLPKTQISVESDTSSKQKLVSELKDDIPKKLNLKPEQIKLNLKQSIEKFKNIDKKITALTSKEELIEKDKPITQEELIQPDKYVSHEKNITDEIVSNAGFDFARELKKLIMVKGSNLSLRLCEKFINEMLSSLEEPLKLEDLEVAADFFIKYEKKI